MEGRCRTSRLFVTRCEAVLEASTGPGRSWRRSVAYDFLGGFDERPVRVMVDPQQPELLTTDAALERLGSRGLALSAAALFAAASIAGAAVLLWRRLR